MIINHHNSYQASINKPLQIIEEYPLSNLNQLELQYSLSLQLKISALVLLLVFALVGTKLKAQNKQTLNGSKNLAIKTKKSAKFPFIDIHTHMVDTSEGDFESFDDLMKSLNMAVIVNVSGRGFGPIKGGLGNISYGPKDGGFFKQAIVQHSKSNRENFFLLTNIRGC